MLAVSVENALSGYLTLQPAAHEVARNGLRQLLQAIADDCDITDHRWAAYMLATVRHECAGRWQPIEEFGKGKGLKYGQPVTVIDTEGLAYTNTYYGRGYVQLTWQHNYAALGRAIGVGEALVITPQLALDPAYAYQVMSIGMRHGLFTGKKLADYINAEQCDYFNARQIINGLDCAELIAGYARELEQLLRPAQSFEATAVV